MTTPQQPDLRPFIVYDRVPRGCFAYLVERDDCAPLIRPGDTVIIDPGQRDPRSGDLFLIQWLSGRQSKAIVEIWPMTKRARILTPEGQTDERPHWMIGGTKRERMVTASGHPILDTRTGEPLLPARWADGPYDCAGVAERMKGRVVGILEASFEEPKRITGEVRP